MHFRNSLRYRRSFQSNNLLSANCTVQYKAISDQGGSKEWMSVVAERNGGLHFYETHTHTHTYTICIRSNCHDHHLVVTRRSCHATSILSAYKHHMRPIRDARSFNGDTLGSICSFRTSYLFEKITKSLQFSWQWLFPNFMYKYNAVIINKKWNYQLFY